MAKKRSASQALLDDESKADKFKRLANRRVPIAVKRIKHCAALANSRMYEYTEEQATKLIDVLTESVRRLKLAYMGNEAEKEFEQLF